VWIKHVITVGKCENADNEKEKHQTAETAPQIVLQTGITPSIHRTQHTEYSSTKKTFLINQSVNQWKLVSAIPSYITLHYSDKCFQGINFNQFTSVKRNRKDEFSVDVWCGRSDFSRKLVPDRRLRQQRRDHQL